MKFVASSDFRLGGEMKDRITLAEESAKAQPHPDHVHKGARLEIGPGEVVKDMKVPDRELIGILVYSGRIVSEKNADAVKLIDAEVKQDNVRLASAAKANKAADATSVIEMLTNFLQGQKAPAK